MNNNNKKKKTTDFHMLNKALKMCMELSATLLKNEALCIHILPQAQI